MNLIKYLFEEKTASEAPFVLGRDTASYKEIYSSALKVCNILENKDGENVLLFGDNSIFWISAYFGIIGSGNVCIPVGSKVSHEDIDDIIKRTNPVAILAMKKHKEDFRGSGVNVFSEREVSGFSEGAIKEVSKDNIATIVFTSGSSGKPKGVMLTHGNILSNTDSIIKYLDLGERDTIEAVLPFCYCYGTSLLHTHTKVGGKIVLNSNFIFLKSVIEDIKNYECTGFAGVPSHFEILIKNTNFLGEKFPKLRYLTQAGGKMRDETIKKIYEGMPSVDLFVMYGQTEATARLSYLPPNDLPNKLGSIGKGIPGVMLKVISESGDEIVPGEIGEIVASGKNIMKGYYQEESDEEKKIVDGWLHTGDMATVDGDGYIFVTSRKDSIVKIAGFRVNIDEVKDKIVKSEGVIDCYVVDVQDKVLGSTLIALVSLEDGFTKENLIFDLRNKLATYQMPKKVLVVENIPLTSSGKVDKKNVEDIVRNG